jgi:hypothetical protein
MNHYNIRLNVKQYFSILSVILHRWKLMIRGIGNLDLIENDIGISQTFFGFCAKYT